MQLGKDVNGLLDHAMVYALTPTHLAPRKLTSWKLDWVSNPAHFTFALSPLTTPLTLYVI